MKTKTQDRLLTDAIRAYNEENRQKLGWEREAKFWYGRALQAEFVLSFIPWVFMALIVAGELIAIIWAK